MAQSLTDFLMANPVNNIEDEVVISERLKNYKFRIRPYSSDEYEAYVKRFREIGKKGKISFNDAGFSRAVIINCTLYPKFSDAEMLKAAGCKTPHEYLDKYLTAGEIKTLEGKISELSGFDQDLESLVDEVKN